MRTSNLISGICTAPLPTDTCDPLLLQLNMFDKICANNDVTALTMGLLVEINIMQHSHKSINFYTSLLF
jgi:hypothetical protein